MKLKLLLVLLPAITFFSCEKRDSKTITVKDLYTIELSNSFEETKNLNEDASLQYQDIARQLFVIVIDEPKDSVISVLTKNKLCNTYPTGLKGYSNLIIAGINPSLSIDSIPVFNETIINGLTARQTSFEGKSGENKIFWYLTFLEGKNSFYQVMVSTIAENHNILEKEMQQITNSFAEKESIKKQ